MLDIAELKDIKAALIALRAGQAVAIEGLLEALDWAIQAETDIKEIHDGGGFKSAAAYRRITARQAISKEFPKPV